MEQTTSKSAELLLDRLTEFCAKHIPRYQGKEKFIKRIINAHIYYKTFDYMEKDGKIVACVRWNIEPSGKVCSVLDLIIAKEVKKYGFKVMKTFIARNWLKSPWVTHLQFGRNMKYPNRKKRLYKIQELLKRRR